MILGESGLLAISPPNFRRSRGKRLAMRMIRAGLIVVRGVEVWLIGMGLVLMGVIPVRKW
ncbi:MAG: hypothetical protein ABSG65_04800 [Bryobacteraceae bacterium]|jgi:hypothetical protein